MITREGDSPLRNLTDNQEPENQDATFQLFENLAQNQLKDQDLGQEVEGDQWGEDDIELPLEEIQQQQQEQKGQVTQEISANQSVLEVNCRNSLFAGEQIALGNFERAMELLKKQVCAINFKPFRPIFEAIYMNNSSLLTQPFTPFSKQYEQNQNIVFAPKYSQFDESNYSRKKQYLRPFVYPTLDLLKSELSQAYSLTNAYKLQEALNKFHNILLMIPLMVLTKSNEEENIRTLLEIVVEYRLALFCEVKKQHYKDNPERLMELVSYSAACKVQPQHQILFLKSAMNLSYKQSNFVYAVYFSRRILSLVETNPTLMKPDVLAKTQKLLQICEQKGTNAMTIQFSQEILNSSMFIDQICAKQLKLISKQENKIKCPFCSACFEKNQKGKVCPVCEVSQIGGEALGLKIQL